MGKREVPMALRQLLKFDVYLTNNFCTCMDKIFPPEKYRKHFKGLELSCHGIPWIVFWIGSIWIFWLPILFQMQINFFFGLLIDIIAVALLKAFTRRRRPINNKPDMLFMVGPDKFSFPSGHVSRSAFIALFFTVLYPVNLLVVYLLWTWSIAVSISRILMRRHHILDVLGGVLLGLATTSIIGFFWLSDASARSLVMWLSDDTFDGGQDDI